MSQHLEGVVSVAGGEYSGPAIPLPKCFCNWKHCRTYQKAFREFKHPLLNGVIKLKFVKNDRKSLALKATVDRTLHVDSEKRNEWREVENESMCRYYIARHHFTEALIKQYLGDKRAWDWSEPLSMRQAKIFLWSLDRQDVYHSEDEVEEDEADDSPTRYIQAPNVPKEQVREVLRKLKEESKKVASLPSPLDSTHISSLPINSASNVPKSPNKTQNSTHTQTTLGTSITDAVKSFDGDVGGTKYKDVSDVALALKDEENKRLREELNECQKQLSMLTNLVSKLQVDIRSGDTAGDGNPAARWKATKKKKEDIIAHEEDYKSIWDEGKIFDDDDDEEDDEDWSGERPQESGDEETISTYHVHGNMNGSHSGRTGSRHSSSVRKGSSQPKRPLRRESVHSLRSMPSRSRHSGRRDSIRSHRSIRGGTDDGASVMSLQSLQSVSPSIRSLPREIQLMGDEEDSKGTYDLSFFDDTTDNQFVTDKQIVDPYGEKGVYSGTLSKSTGMPNGKGRLEYEKEGRWYEGDWIHGRWTGYGRLSNGDGDFYEGWLKNDHKHGTGKMLFADGRIFEGEYIRGQMIQGKMTYQDGSVYGGSWVDGMRHGKGKCIFVDGSEYEGEFREGNFHGNGTMTWNDGGWYVGEWCDGEMHGNGKEIRPDGTLRHDGQWSRGQPIRSASDSRRRRHHQQQQQQQM